MQEPVRWITEGRASAVDIGDVQGECGSVRMLHADDEKRGVSCSAKSAGGYDVRRGVWRGVRRNEMGG